MDTLLAAPGGHAWRGWLVPLRHRQGQLLLFDNGAQDSEIQVEAAQQLVFGTWTDLHRHVVFSSLNGDFDIEDLTRPDLDSTIR